MKKKVSAPASADAPALAMPSQGGSYIRQEDGSLERVEFTTHEAPTEEPAPQADATATATEQEA